MFPCAKQAKQTLALKAQCGYFKCDLLKMSLAHTSCWISHESMYACMQRKVHLWGAPRAHCEIITGTWLGCHGFVVSKKIKIKNNTWHSNHDSHSKVSSFSLFFNTIHTCGLSSVCYLLMYVCICHSSPLIASSLGHGVMRHSWSVSVALPGVMMLLLTKFHTFHIFLLPSQPHKGNYAHGRGFSAALY